MPVSNSTVLPSTSRASRQRHANSMRFNESGGVHFSQTARGALPYIAPPSSRWRLPSTDQSFTSALVRSRIRCRAELQLREPRVQRARLNELLVAAGRDYSAVVHHDDPIRLEHRR